MKKVQIDEELFVRLCGFFILGHRDATQEKVITDALQDKLNRLQAHTDYMKNRTGT